jgi:hypothetical protein
MTSRWRKKGLVGGKEEGRADNQSETETDESRRTKDKKENRWYN